jgi:hypothetical protein
MALRNEGSGTTAQGKPSDNLLLRLARDHVALLLSIIGALIFAFRCVVVSAGDPYVAFILVTETSVGDAVRALLFTVVPILLLLLSLVVSFTAMARIIMGRPPGLKTAGMGLIILAVGGVLSLGGWFVAGIFQRPFPVIFVAGLALLLPLALQVVYPG